MKFWSVLAVAIPVLLHLSGCSSTQRLQHLPVSEVSVEGAAKEKKGQAYRLFYVAQLLETSYLEPSKAINTFNKLGFNATYFSPKYKWFFNFPEVYLLSKAQSNQLMVLFVGTNGVGDWIENNNSSVSEDETLTGSIYIPQGHKGFRNGIRHLADNGFFDEIIPAHVSRYQVRRESTAKVQLIVAGHSQGAGLAQLATPALDGYRHIGSAISQEPNWPYEVEAIYSYAPPYAIAHKGRAWQFMSDTFGAKTYQIIRDSDYITTVYSVARFGHHVPYRHFGQYLRITRDDVVVAEPTFWGSQVTEPHQSQPHQLSGYRHALEQEGL